MKNEGLSKATVNADQAGAAVQVGEPRTQRIPHNQVMLAVSEAIAKEEVGQATGGQAVPYSVSSIGQRRSTAAATDPGD